jgi:hypothetical protein
MCAEGASHTGNRKGVKDVRTKIKDDLSDYGKPIRAVFGRIWEEQKAEYG